MIDRKSVWVFVCATVCALVVFGCARKPVQSDIVLVTVDGVLDAPIMDAGSQVLVFKNAYSPAPFTLPAAASVLTGLLPPEHGLRINGVGALSPNIPTLATELATRGYECAAFLSSAALDPRHGLTNGFSKYVLVPPSSPGMVAEVAAHLKVLADRKRPQFVWVHVSAFADGANTNELASVDARIEAGWVCKGVQDLFGADTVRAVVSLFGVDPEASFSGLSLDDASVRVQMAVSGLGESVKDQAYTAQISIADIKAMLLSGQVEPKALVYSESILPWYAFGLLPLQVVRGEGAVLPPLGLEVVKSDALATQTQMMVLRRNGHLGEGLIPAYTNAFGVAALDAEGTSLVTQAASALALSGEEGVVAVRALVQEYPSVALFYEWLGNLYWQARDYTEACNAYGKASDLGVNRVWAYRQQSKCHLLIGNVPLAIDKAENAFLLNPDDPALRYGLSRLLLNTGSALLAGGQYESAAECLSRVRWLEPGNADGIFQQARLQLEVGQTNNATGLLKEALKIKPEHVPAKRMLEGLR